MHSLSLSLSLSLSIEPPFLGIEIADDADALSHSPAMHCLHLTTNEIEPEFLDGKFASTPTPRRLRTRISHVGPFPRSLSPCRLPNSKSYQPLTGKMLRNEHVRHMSEYTQGRRLEKKGGEQRRETCKSVPYICARQSVSRQRGQDS